MSAERLPEPRAVAWTVRMAMYTHGAIRQFGWVFAALGSLFCGFFLHYTDLRIGGYDAHASGEVVKLEATNSSSNDRRIYAVVFRFRGGEPAQDYQDTSYTTAPPGVGDQMGVEYEWDDPDEARMQGAHSRPFSPVLSLVLIFPLAGMGFALIRIGESRRVVWLLRRGRAVKAKVIARGKGNMKINETSETKLTLQFVDDRGLARTFDVSTFSPELLEDDAEELALYDPDRPQRAITLDHLPGKLKVHDDRVEATGSVGQLLFLPIMALSLSVGALVSRLVW